MDEGTPDAQRPVASFGLWAAALGGPSAWFADLCSRYFLVESGWAIGREPALVALGSFWFVVAAAAGVLSHRHERRLRAAWPGAALVASLGTALGGFSAFVILAALVPHGFASAGQGP